MKVIVLEQALHGNWTHLMTITPLNQDDTYITKEIDRLSDKLNDAGQPTLATNNFDCAVWFDKAAGPVRICVREVK